ncbi:MAG TPA: hypothetical protein VF221_05010 [Chloroflexota bacterium]
MTSGNDATDENRDAPDSPDADEADTTLADGTPSGAAGVVHAELGTSGPPASEILTPEELARVEMVGGTGLKPNAVPPEELKEYFEDPQDLEQRFEDPPH